MKIAWEIIELISIIGFIVITLIATCRMIGDALSVNAEDKKWWKALFVSNDRKTLNEIKRKIDEIKLKDDKLQRLNEDIDESIIKIYNEFFALFGVKREEIESVIRRYLFEKEVKDLKYPLNELILLLGQCTYEFGREVTYGTETPVNTKYYINTMSITHDTDSGRIMCMLLNKLMLQVGTYPIDFIITPKSGNPILAHKFANMFKIPIILLHKSESESSRVMVSPEDEPERFLQVNYEGFDQLKSYVEKGQKNIKGVAIDCNTSGGKQLLKATSDFNKYIDKVPLGKKIERVKKAFVLFRAEGPPDSNSDIDNIFRSEGIEIIRYFDCNEDIKEKLAKLSSYTGSTKDVKVKEVIEALEMDTLLRFKMEVKDEH